MPVREYRASDLEEIKHIHEDSGIDYQLPDLSSPLFIVRKVVEADGHILVAGAAKLQVELYIWVNHNRGTPEERYEGLKEMNEAAMKELYWDKGVDEAVCWVPVQLEKSFAKRLGELGLTRDREEFHTWSRKTK